MSKPRFVALSISISLWAVSPALGEPQGGTVRAGSATIEAGTITQHTDRAIIDWQQFNIAPNERVRFVQPSRLAVLMNRVVGSDPSVILGRLQANGQLFLVNPNGILFGPGWTASLPHAASP